MLGGLRRKRTARRLHDFSGIAYVFGPTAASDKSPLLVTQSKQASYKHLAIEAVLARRMLTVQRLCNGMVPWRRTLSDRRPTAGSRVSFRLADVVCPEHDRIVSEMGPELAVMGEVVLQSDRGVQRDGFVIVQVPGIAVPLVVPAEKLLDIVNAAGGSMSSREFGQTGT